MFSRKVMGKEPWSSKEIIISIKNFTVVGFDKLHIGVAILDFSLLQLLFNQTAQIPQDLYLIFNIVPNR